MDRTTHPPVVTELHLLLDDWLGDDLLEVYPCHIVTERLAEKLRASQLTGFSIDPMFVTRSEEFLSLPEPPSVPPLYWLRVYGTMVDDFAVVANPHALSLSSRALSLIRVFTLNNAEIIQAQA